MSAHRPVLPVEAEHPEFLDLQSRCDWCEMCGDQFRPIEERRDPDKFRQELFRSIYARAGELGWSREKLYRFAAERLPLRYSLTSLKQLTPDQLRNLADRLRRVPETVV